MKGKSGGFGVFFLLVSLLSTYREARFALTRFAPVYREAW